MSDAAKAPRTPPLSPHLQIWRWHITMAASILHRVTGVGLYLGALIAAAWAVSLAAGPETYVHFKGLPTVRPAPLRDAVAEQLVKLGTLKPADYAPGRYKNLLGN